ncbi:hypothetical protein BGZ68_000476, partial [Mortierella alpina]
MATRLTANEQVLADNCKGALHDNGQALSPAASIDLNQEIPDDGSTARCHPSNLSGSIPTVPLSFASTSSLLTQPTASSPPATDLPCDSRQQSAHLISQDVSASDISKQGQTSYSARCNSRDSDGDSSTKQTSSIIQTDCGAGRSDGVQAGAGTCEDEGKGGSQHSRPFYTSDASLGLRLSSELSPRETITD